MSESLRIVSDTAGVNEVRCRNDILIRVELVLDQVLAVVPAKKLKIPARSNFENTESNGKHDGQEENPFPERISSGSCRARFHFSGREVESIMITDKEALG